MVVTSAKANLVIDGNFNSNGEGTPSPFTTITAGYTIGNTGGWLVTAGSVDLIGTYWNAPTAGGNSVDMAGNSSGTIQQTVQNLVVGQEYELTFALSGNPDGSPSVKDLGVGLSILGATTDTFSYSTLINGQHSLNYQTQKAFFTATSTSEILQFQDQSSYNGTTPYGAVIGDVSLAAVPEVSTIAAGALMLLPLGVSALRIMRKNQLA